MSAEDAPHKVDKICRVKTLMEPAPELQASSYRGCDAPSRRLANFFVRFLISYQSKLCQRVSWFLTPSHPGKKGRTEWAHLAENMLNLRKRTSWRSIRLTHVRVKDPCTPVYRAPSTSISTVRGIPTTYILCNPGTISLNCLNPINLQP